MNSSTRSRRDRVPHPRALILAVAAATGSCGGVPGSHETVPPSSSDLPSVNVAQAETRTLEPAIELEGRLVGRPEDIAQLSVRVAGTIVEVLGIEGDTVAAGDVVVRLDDTILAGRLALAEAQVREKEATLARLVAGARREEIELAESEVRRAQAIARGTALAVKPLEELLSKAEVSKIRLEKARADQEAAESALVSARARLSLLQSGTRPERILEAQALLSAARADAGSARARLGFTTLTAPRGGTLTRMFARVGLSVSPGAMLVEITDLDVLLMRVRVPNASVASLLKGASVPVRLRGAGKDLEGTLDRIGPVADVVTGGYWVFVRVQNTGSMRPGMTGSATFHLAAVENCTAVPFAAVSERSGVTVATRVVDGCAREVVVQTGVRSAGWIQILEGLDPGDVVATEGGYGLPDGQRVNIVPDARTP